MASPSSSKDDKRIENLRLDNLLPPFAVEKDDGDDGDDCDGEDEEEEEEEDEEKDEEDEEDAIDNNDDGEDFLSRSSPPLRTSFASLFIASTFNIFPLSIAASKIKSSIDNRRALIVSLALVHNALPDRFNCVVPSSSIAPTAVNALVCSSLLLLLALLPPFPLPPLLAVASVSSVLSVDSTADD